MPENLITCSNKDKHTKHKTSTQYTSLYKVVEQVEIIDAGQVECAFKCWRNPANVELGICHGVSWGPKGGKNVKKKMVVYMRPEIDLLQTGQNMNKKKHQLRPTRHAGPGPTARLLPLSRKLLLFNQ